MKTTREEIYLIMMSMGFSEAMKDAEMTNQAASFAGLVAMADLDDRLKILGEAKRSAEQMLCLLPSLIDKITKEIDATTH